MATKKCPKCGEENPAEAVMCWACYTPLAGGAAAVAGGGLVTPRGGAAAVTPAATAAAQNTEKTSVDPKIFVVVGLLIAAAVIGSFTTGLIGGPGGGTEITPDVTQITDTEPGTSGPPMPTTQTNITVTAPPSFTPPTNSGPSIAPAQTPQFKTVVPPDPRRTTGTMAILVNTPNISASQALDMAKSARQQFQAGGKWTGMQVVVFSDPGAVRTFSKYQTQRKGDKLTPYQYQELANQGVWNSVPAYYETRGKSGVPYYPSASPKGWWSRR